MSSYAGRLRRQLNKLIDEMAKRPEPYSKNPGRNFTRSGKLGLMKTIQIMLHMEGKSISHELREFFLGQMDVPSASAFVQSQGDHPKNCVNLRSGVE